MLETVYIRFQQLKVKGVGYIHRRLNTPRGTFLIKLIE